MVCTSFELNVIHSSFHCFILPQPLDVIQNKYRPSSTEQSFIYLKIYILFPVTLFGDRHFRFFLLFPLLSQKPSLPWPIYCTRPSLCISHKDDTWATAYLLTLSNICLMHTSQYYSIFFFSSQSHCIVILCFLPKSMNHFLSSAVKLYVPSTCYRYDGPCGFLWLLILDSREENYFYLYYIHYYLI